MLVNQICRRSPLVCVGRGDSSIVSPHQMHRKRIAFAPPLNRDSPLIAMLTTTGGGVVTSSRCPFRKMNTGSVRGRCRLLRHAACRPVDVDGLDPLSARAANPAMKRSILDAVPSHSIGKPV